MKSTLRSRVALLALLLVALTGSFLLLTPKSAAATPCPSGGYLVGINVYYTDSSRTTVSCIDRPCEERTLIRYLSGRARRS